MIAKIDLVAADTTWLQHFENALHREVYVDNMLEDRIRYHEIVAPGRRVDQPLGIVKNRHDAGIVRSGSQQGPEWSEIGTGAFPRKPVSEASIDAGMIVLDPWWNPAICNRNPCSESGKHQGRTKIEARADFKHIKTSDRPADPGFDLLQVAQPDLIGIVNGRRDCTGACVRARPVDCFHLPALQLQPSKHAASDTLVADHIGVGIPIRIGVRVVAGREDKLLIPMGKPSGTVIADRIVEAVCKAERPTAFV